MENTMEQIGPRMRQILNSIPNQLPLFDIACDHGLIGLTALIEGKCSEVIFIDQVEKIIEKLNIKVKKYPKNFQDKIRMIAINAAKYESYLPTANYVIAGIGGNTMLSIIDQILKVVDVKTSHFIFVPHQQIFEFRQGLIDRELAILNETVIMENGKFREVIVSNKSGQKATVFGQYLKMIDGNLPIMYWEQLLKYHQMRSLDEKRLNCKIQLEDFLMAIKNS